MYWPTNAANIIALPAPLSGSPLIALRASRRGNLFATLSRDTLGVWDVRVSAAIDYRIENRSSSAYCPSSCRYKEQGQHRKMGREHRRRVDFRRARHHYPGTPSSIIRWCRAHWQTSTSHLLVYQLQSTSQPAYEPTAPNYPRICGPGEAEPLVGFTLKPLGAAFIMGNAAAIVAQPHALMMGLKHPPSITSVPWPIPTEHLSPAGSHFPPNPLDGGSQNEDFNSWDVAQGKEWLMAEGQESILCWGHG